MSVHMCTPVPLVLRHVEKLYYVVLMVKSLETPDLKGCLAHLYMVVKKHMRLILVCLYLVQYVIGRLHCSI